LQSGEVVLGPAGEFAVENGFSFDEPAVETGRGFFFFGFDELDANGAAAEGVGHGADAGDDGGGKGVEGADGIALAFATVGASALFVSGVEEAAQFFGVKQVGIYFVKEEGWLVLGDEAEEDRGSEVLGAKGSWSHGGDEIDGGGLATLGLDRGEIQARGMEKGARGVGVRVPEGDGLGTAARQDDTENEAVGDLVEDFRAVDGFGPGFNDRQFDGAGLGVVVGFESAPGDFGVEGLEADAEAHGFGFADAVVLGGGKPGEGGEGFGIVKRGA